MPGVIIVGTGATASLVATHFVNRGEEVTMLERGLDEPYAPSRLQDRWSEGWRESIEDGRLIARNSWTGLTEDPDQHLGSEGSFDDLGVIENAHDPFGFHYNMRLGFGGSSAVWSGRVWRFYDEDFATKTHFGFGLDWPITAAEMAPFYDAAEELLGVSGPMQDDWPFPHNYQTPAYAPTYLDRKVGGLFKDHFNFFPTANAVRRASAMDGGCVGAKTCVSFCPTNALYRHYQVLADYRGTPGFKILGDRIVSDVDIDPDGFVNKISYISRDHGRGEIDVDRGTRVFLCGNTIENTRMLLNSGNRTGKSIANQSGLLGAYFASHGATVREVVAKDDLQPGKSRPSTSAGLDPHLGRKRDGIGSYMVELWNFNHRHGSPHRALMRLRHETGLWGRALFEAADHLKRSTPVSAIFELEMRERNRITASEATDKWGIPIAKVDFKMSERDMATFEHLNRILDGVADHPDCERVGDYGYGLNGNHPMGGYVSATSPSGGVTDRRGQAFGHPNLFVMGGGLFASGSCFNPTLTITANTLRCLDEIEDVA